MHKCKCNRKKVLVKSFDQLKTNKFIITNFKKKHKKQKQKTKHTNFKMNTKSKKKTNNNKHV